MMFTVQCGHISILKKDEQEEVKENHSFDFILE